MKTSNAVQVKVTKQEKLMSLKKVNELVKMKIREDLFRFRTCCADVRASK